MTMSSMYLHPERLLPVDARVRPIARRLYDAVQGLPILSPHGHVDARLLVDDEPFNDPASLLISADHYVTRLLHATGVQLSELGVGQGPLPERQARQAWRRMCEHWAVFRGTPVKYWMESELTEIFGVTERPGPDTADLIYDQLAERLREPEFRPRALFRRFGIEGLATPDDPCDDLAAPRALAADPGWTARVIPTFRPDRYLEPGHDGWVKAVTRLGETADIDISDYAGYLRALEERRRYFVENG